MAKYTNPLEQGRVAAPCSADWNRMSGNDRVRFCDRCNLNVYNLSEMSKRDAEALIRRTEGRLCVRFYRRTDGTILTDNCPVGLRAIKRRISRIASTALSAVLSFFAGTSIYGFFGEKEAFVQPERVEMMGTTPLPAIETKPYLQPAVEYEWFGPGKMAVPMGRLERYPRGTKKVK